jgi:hypothetical protein
MKLPIEAAKREQATRYKKVVLVFTQSMTSGGTEPPSTLQKKGVRRIGRCLTK